MRKIQTNSCSIIEVIACKHRLDSCFAYGHVCRFGNNLSGRKLHYAVPRDWSAYMCWLTATRTKQSGFGICQEIEKRFHNEVECAVKGFRCSAISFRKELLAGTRRLSGARPMGRAKNIYQKSNGKFLEKYLVGPLRDAFTIAHAIPMSEGVHGEAEEILMPTRICLDAALLLFLMQLYIHLILEGYSVVDVPEFIRLY